MASSKRGTSLHFNVSSGLKSVLGSELITDDQVAVFELVKNSFDAQARSVRIFFDSSRVIVADDGSGMTLDEIRTKWLFVAYSSKREQDPQKTTRKKSAKSYRDAVADRKNYAGSKGIGRFSSDRLGSTVILQTRPRKDPTEPVHRVEVNWDEFDKNLTQRFDKIQVAYSALSDGFLLPKSMPQQKYGTIVEIVELRQPWTRKKILGLKSALAKLINPFGSKVDGFQISIVAPDETKDDEAERERAKQRSEDVRLNAVVNGDVGNFIFDTLQEKTTFIEVSISAIGTNTIVETRLVDRGETVYKIREPNPYALLAGSSFSCQLFFLNQAAKATFTRRVGLPSVQFGSVFVFRNGFRVFPIGEEGDDWFGIDRRKQQGYARFLGTRDIIGRIDVSGSDKDFKEASSRNDGLIETEAVGELHRCFWEHCLKRLERYVVPVSWADAEDKNVSDLSRLSTDPGKARVAAALASLVDDENIELLEYSTKLIDVLNERSAQFTDSIASLRAIAERAGDKVLARRLDQAELRFEELQRSEADAKRQADEERKAKEAAQERATRAEHRAREESQRYEEERKRNLFLTSIASLDTETILNMHHQITIYAVDMQHQLENFIAKVGDRPKVPRAEVLNALEQVAFLNRRVMAISKFATKANFRLQSEAIESPLGTYVQQYIDSVVRDFLSGPIRVEIQTEGQGISRRFKPIDISIVVDNLVANAKKAGASLITFAISHPTKSSFLMRVSDNGKGLNVGSKSDRVFEKGFSTTDGSGLGLYHVRQVLGEMNGSIEIDKNVTRGAAFIIRVGK